MPKGKTQSRGKGKRGKSQSKEDDAAEFKDDIDVFMENRDKIGLTQDADEVRSFLCLLCAKL